MNMANISRQASQLWQKLKHFLQNLNLFPSVPPSTDEYQLHTQRISTRLFIFFLIVSMTILLLYTSLVTVTKTINVEAPPLTQYSQLYSTYSQTLTCPCTKISINYRKFLRIEYTLHQVCSSIFVNESWINYMAEPNATTLFLKDFRVVSTDAFQALRALCQLLNTTISDSFIEFHSRQYVSASVMPSKLFETETDSLINRFKSSMTNSFLLSLSMIRDTTQANALWSARKTNYIIRRHQNGGISVSTQYYGNCSCSSSSECSASASIYDENPNPEELFDVRGFYSGCYVLEALLQSTLECFYDQTCINRLQEHFLSSSAINAIALNSSSPSNYSINSTIKDLVGNLMIEQWNVSTMYERFYNECQPTQCTYRIETRNDLIYIITTVFGIVGGVITVLKLVVPRSVKLVRKKRELPGPATAINNQHWITILWQKFQYDSRNLNLFPSVPPSTDEHELRTQRISTRLFIFLLIVSMTILLLYTSLITVTKTINVEPPPLTQYLQLYSTYSQTLACACTQISMHYGKFLRIEYTLHQVCSSIFVNESWINYMANTIEAAMYPFDFRVTSPNAFQALRALCQLLNTTISDSFIEFYSRQYVSASVMPSKLFETETDSLINRFKSSMTNSFLLSLSMIRDTTQANALWSGRKTNYNLKPDQYGSQHLDIVKYGNCSCSSSSECSASASIYKAPKREKLFDVRGFYSGCYVLEALFQSTLECFYDQTCINELQVYFSASSAINATALNSSSPSNYSINSTIKDLVRNLMIEQWNVSTMYERYYNECQPTQCTYRIETRNDLIYIVTALFGILGGLMTALKLVVPRLVKLARKKRTLPGPATSKKKSKMPRFMKFNFGVLQRNSLQ